MAIFVDKDKKRKDIAIKCTNLLLEKGLKNLRIAEIAKTAGIGKGTVYDYFDNKEAVVFEIIRNLMREHQSDLLARSGENTSCKQKVKYLFDFFLCKYKDYSKHLEVYKEYIAATLVSKSPAMHDFNQECTEFFKKILNDIINEGISKKEIIADSYRFVDSFIATERGFMVLSWTENKNTKTDFNNYIDFFFTLLEVKK